MGLPSLGLHLLTSSVLGCHVDLKEQDRQRQQTVEPKQKRWIANRISQDRSILVSALNPTCGDQWRCFQGLIAGRHEASKSASQLARIEEHLKGKPGLTLTIKLVEAKQGAEGLFPDVHQLYSRALRGNLKVVGQLSNTSHCHPHRCRLTHSMFIQFATLGVFRWCYLMPTSTLWFASLSLPRDFVQSVLGWAATLKQGCTTWPNVDNVSFVELNLHW